MGNFLKDTCTSWFPDILASNYLNDLPPFDGWLRVESEALQGMPCPKERVTLRCWLGTAFWMNVVSQVQTSVGRVSTSTRGIGVGYGFQISDPTGISLGDTWVDTRPLGVLSCRMRPYTQLWGVSKFQYLGNTRTCQVSTYFPGYRYSIDLGYIVILQ